MASIPVLVEGHRGSHEELLGCLEGNLGVQRQLQVARRKILETYSRDATDAREKTVTNATNGNGNDNDNGIGNGNGSSTIVPESASEMLPQTSKVLLQTSAVPLFQYTVMREALVACQPLLDVQTLGGFAAIVGVETISSIAVHLGRKT